jgi:enamine deaminase RidA (YjgF/YER057c/UK114 family)
MNKASYAIVALTVGLAASCTAVAQTSPEARLKELNLTLPAPTRVAAAGNRTGAGQIGNIL